MIPLDFDLPNFDDPPVGEVVLSVQFPKIEIFQAAHFGQFWDVLGTAKYPATETHPPLPPTVERFDSPAGSPKVSVQFRELPPIPRVWFVNTDGTHLIQVQPDRFTCNWRKIRADDRYPRYDQVRAQFDTAWKSFVDFLLDQKLVSTSPEIIQCEVGYINHIAQSGVWSNYREASKVLTLLSGDSQLASCLTQEAVSLATSYAIRVHESEAEAPIGRLHLEFGPGMHTETGRQIFILHLLARGLLKAAGTGDNLEFLDLGRKVIVNSFALISTERMHKVWGLK